MKIGLLLLVCLFSFSLLSSGQAGEWTWIHGSNIASDTGNHGTQGIPSALNNPPALYEPSEFTDLSGNFWMYGGIISGGGIANDLWKYDPASGVWTWMFGTDAIGDPGNFGAQGVASATNRPPGIGFAAASWVDKSGNFWLFGGWNSNPYGYYSALWKYDVGSNEWTWMNGPNTINSTGVYGTQGVPNAANYPWSRTECSSAWTDNAGDLWLFSGGGTTGFNDLWRYNIASNTWTWMKGSNTGGQPGVYGTKGVENPANTPGGRESHSRWKDNSGNLWEFGGLVGGTYNMNDLWRYNPSSNNWAWMEGAGTTGTTAGVYGTKCVTAATNSPGQRYENRATWTDVNGNFWMFGGDNYDNTLGNRFLNDLWMYCVASNQWTWISGDSTYNSSGSWGTINVASPSNKPNGRAGAVGWRDNSGNLYLFGGTSGINYVIPYNDLWKYTIDPSCGSSCVAVVPPVANFQASDSVLCANDCISFTDHSTNATSWLWTFTGAAPSSSTDQNPSFVCYLDSGIYNVKLVVSGSGGTDSITFTNYINVAASPPTPLIAQSGDTLKCTTDPSYTSYQWDYNDTLIAGATNPTFVATKSGNYNIKVSNGNGCSVAVGINVVVEGIPNQVSAEGLNILLSPNPVRDMLNVKFSGQTGDGIIVIYNSIGEKIMEEKIATSTYYSFNVKDFPSGVYIIYIRDEKGTRFAKFVKE